MSLDPEAHWWIDAASGAAPCAVRGLFASWAEINGQARETAKSLDILGAIMLADGPGSGVVSAPDLTHRAGTNTPPSVDPLYPSPLARLGFRSESPPWRSRLGGIRARKIEAWCEPGVDARLFQFDADAGIPQHDHHGDEFTLVLSGGFFDQAGIYNRGDMACAHAGLLHEPRSLPDESCICVTVSIGGYRFRNPLVSLASAFLK